MTIFGVVRDNNVPDIAYQASCASFIKHQELEVHGSVVPLSHTPHI